MVAVTSPKLAKGKEEEETKKSSDGESTAPVVTSVKALSCLKSAAEPDSRFAKLTTARRKEIE